MRLRGLYLTVILAVGLLPLGLSSWWALHTSRATLRSEAEANLRLISRLIGDDFDNYLATVRERLRGRSTYPEFATFAEEPSATNFSRVAEVLDRVRNIDPLNITSAALFVRHGRKWLDTDAGEEATEEAHQPWIAETLRTTKGQIIPETAPGRRPVLWVTAPLRNEQGDLVGVLRVRLQLAVLQQIIHRATEGGQTYAVLQDEGGVILAHGRDPEAVGTRPPEEAWPAVGREPLIIPAAQLNQQGERVRVAGIRLGEVPWVLAVHQQEELFESGSRKLLQVTLLLVALTLAVSALAGWLAAGWLSRPIQQIAKVAERIDQGDLKARAEEEGPGEVKQLARSFNQMTTHLQEVLTDLENRVEARTQQLSRTNAELESFSYAVSHDLRSPLRAIDGFSRALEEDCAERLAPEEQDYLRRIRAATQRMGRLIDDLLMLAKMSRAELRLAKVDLVPLAHEVMAELRAGEPQRALSFTAPSSLPAQADANLIRIVLANLLHNAWKYTRRTEAPRVELGHEVGPGEDVFWVRDNGAGFDPRYAGKLFGAFQRMHSPAEFEGNGIGLATVRRIINRHGGRIWAEAEPGRGATFFFTLGEAKPRPSASTGRTHSPFGHPTPPPTP